ncbi:NAD kinase [Porphyromonas gingivalis]|uniref:NAD kinase n=1 Tax=Porphyromonas gingivalis TaxID=837 RepID=UPI000C18F158|nr:NAD kinase [Porphyromonas gingivalis]ATR91320.1 NAD kinase [Porphyromonas gingivalis]
MKKIAIFGSRHKSEQGASIKALILKLEEAGTPLYIERKFLSFLEQDLDFHPAICGVIDTLPEHIDYVICMGGDGTFLRTAHQIGVSQIPVLGVNTGRLGFLTDVDCHEASELITRLLDGDFTIETRSLLEVTEDNGSSPSYALNEAAILKRETGSMIRVNAYLNDDYLAAYDADGLVVATPSGSTAYSLSGNGPIIMPACRNFVLTPIAPHSLNMRPLVVPDDTVIRLEVDSRSRNYLLVLDGRTRTLPCDTSILLKQAPHTLRMIRLRPHSFAETLRRKLMWGAAVR